MCSKAIITVGMPVKNGSKYLSRTLDCILAQNDVDLRVIASDNCSEDETSQILEEYSNLDSRIQVYSQTTPLSATENFEFVLDKAQTEYFCWAAADDLRHPDFCKLLLATIGDKGGAFGRYCIYDLLNDEIVQEPLLPNLSLFDKRRDQLKAYLSVHRVPNMIYGLFRTSCLKEIFRRATKDSVYDMQDIVILSWLISKYGMNTIHDCPIMFYGGQEGKEYTPKPTNGYKLDPSRYEAEILILALKNVLVKEVIHGVKEALECGRLKHVAMQLARRLSYAVKKHS